MGNKIINDNDFANLKLYEEDTDMHKIVSAKVKEIFSRLFQGTEVNPDDFYFTIFEDKQANAFFIKKEHTEDKKRNVIAISRGLISECSNEDELAGIIAHECGHYLWNELLGGKNSIYQEVSADLRAVDLLMNGGYNPRNHLNICKKALTKGVRRTDVTIDVHGNSLARVDYVENYLTLKANENGNFPPIPKEPDTDYQNFQKEVEKTYLEEGYNTWLETKLIEKYNTKDISKLGVNKVLSAISEELDKMDVFVDSYLRQINSTVEKMSEDKYFDNKTQETIKLCEDIFSKMENFRQRVLEQEKFESWRVSLCKSINQSMLKFFKLDLFGDFKKQQENIANLCQSTTQEDTIFLAKEMYKLQYTLPYANCFNKTPENEWPELKPLGKDNIGKKLPNDQLLDYIQHASREEVEALSFVRSTLLNSSNQEVYSYHQFDIKEYFLDKDGVVLYYGEEALAKNKEKDEEFERLKNLENAKIQRQTAEENYKTDIETLEAYNTLALFVQEKDLVKKKEYADQLQQSIFYRNSWKVREFRLKTSISTMSYQNDFLDKLIDEFHNSEAFKYFVKDKDQIIDQLSRVDQYLELQKDIDKSKRIENLTEEQKAQSKSILEFQHKAYTELNRYIGINERIEFKEALSNAFMELTRYFEENGYQDQGVEALYKHTEECVEKAYSFYVSNVDRGLIIEKGKDSARIIDPYEEDYKRRTKALRQKYDRQLAMSSQLQRVNSINKITLENFKYNEKAQILEDVIKKAQFPEDRTQILHAGTIFNGNGFGKEELWSKIGILTVADELRQGKDVNIRKTIESIHFCDVSRGYQPIVADIFAKAIEERGNFEELSLNDKLYVYEVLEVKNLFSEKYANKEKYLKSIVKDIIEYPDKDKVIQIAENFLRNRFSALVDKRPIEKRDERIDFLSEKDKLIDFYAQYYADRLGIDDGSEEYLEKANLLTDSWILKDLVTDEEKFPQLVKQSILRSISDKVVSQEQTAQMMEEKGAAKVDGKDPEKYDYHARLASAVMSFIAKDKQHAKKFIDFITEGYSDESADKLLDYLSNTEAGNKIYFGNDTINLDKYTLKMIHENFWHSSLPVRSVMMKSILHSYSENPEELLDLTINMHFKKDSPYYKDANLVVKTVYNNLEVYEKDLILAALISANKRDKNSQKQDGEAIGEGLKMFFENKGPAFVKFGQLLSYLPQLSPDIRKPLAKLRDKADLPTRAEVFDLLKETLPDEELAKIGRVDKILGAGSFFITAKINYEGKDRVVAVMRPHAKELAQSGMEMITKTISDLAKADNKYEPLKNIAEQARLSAMDETDIEKDYQKFCEAIKIYEDIKIITPKGEFAPHVARWQSYGSGKDNQVYKIIDIAGGEALTSSKMTTEQKHDMAVAYTTVELCNLLAGKKWDTDRHQGQQNFEQKDFSSFVIGIFDTGAQMAKGPNKRDKVFLGKMLYGMIRAARNGENITEYMLKKVKQIDKLGKIFNFDTLYIDDVQRGLTALSDIMTYQKEVKNEKGEVIVPEKSLTSEEIGQIATAIIDSGLMDKDIYNTIKAKAILNKFGVFRKGWAKSLSEGISKIASSIKIEKRDKPIMFVRIKRKDKPVIEQENMTDEDKKTKKLGVSTKHIAKKETNTSLINTIRSRLQKNVS